MIITKCNLRGKMVVTATQMLESMIQNPRPTRAEMTDVANAVLDGTDSVMLSGETANGSFPVAAVSTMAAICQNAEQMVDCGKRFNYLHDYTPKPVSDAEAVASSAVQCAMDMGAKAIIVLTTTGKQHCSVLTAVCILQGNCESPGHRCARGTLGCCLRLAHSDWSGNDAVQGDQQA